jgi:hypothetical protein
LPLLLLEVALFKQARQGRTLLIALLSLLAEQNLERSCNIYLGSCSSSIRLLLLSGSAKNLSRLGLRLLATISAVSKAKYQFKLQNHLYRAIRMRAIRRRRLRQGVCQLQSLREITIRHNKQKRENKKAKYKLEDTA